MSKKTLQGRTKIKHGLVGKTMGRSLGPLVYNEHVGHKVTKKIDIAIMKKIENKK